MQSYRIIHALLFVFAIKKSDAILATMAIDLGSQFFKIGLVKPGVPMEIVLNRESHRKTATIVGLRNGERLFSDAALSMSVKYPKNAFLYLTNLLGKKADNPSVNLNRQRFPFYKINADDNRGTVMFETESGDNYSSETLLAMILSEARKITEKYAEQMVKDVVITVPPFFNQAERRAVVVAAKIAGLNLLQLINDNTAAGLNYGIFRAKDFTETAQTLLIFDMGASKTTASVFEYRIMKDKVTGEKYPQMRTLGVGYDRTLGGLEISLRLRDHLAEQFRKRTTMNTDITNSPRAMAKLFKEAERVKQVLSANDDHVAQIENVHEDRDLRLHVTRKQLDELCSDLLDRMARPIEDALLMAEMSIDHLDQVVLMGGATRGPAVQHKLKAVVGGCPCFFTFLPCPSPDSKELGKFLNTDEAIAIGAVYQAAHLSKGFKVKKFAIIDANLFPIQVDFYKHSEGDSKKIVNRVIYDLKAPFSSKKMLTFSKHVDDFEFTINYGDLKRMSRDELSHFGSLNISRVGLFGVAEAISSNQGEGVHFKGVKAHFRLDDNGIVHMENAEVVVESPPSENIVESAFNSIAGKISGLFTKDDKNNEDNDGGNVAKDEKLESNKENKKKTVKEKTEGEESKKEAGIDERNEDKKEENDEKEDKKEKGAKSDEPGKQNKGTVNGTDSKKANESKPTINKVQLKTEQDCMDILNISKEEMREARNVLNRFDKSESEKADREKTQNSLEAFIYETRDNLDQDEYQQLSSEEERQEIRRELKLAGEWMEEMTDETKLDELEKKLNHLNDICKQLFFKRDQARLRPKTIEAITQMLNHSRSFAEKMRNLTDDLQIFTQIEMDVLEKLINETQNWWDEKQALQQAAKSYEKPAYTLKDVADKVVALNREVEYLLNKAKYTPLPKSKNDTIVSNETNSENDQVEKENVDEEGEKKGENADEEGEKKEENVDEEGEKKEDIFEIWRRAEKEYKEKVHSENDSQDEKREKDDEKRVEL